MADKKKTAAVEDSCVEDVEQTTEAASTAQPEELDALRAEVERLQEELAAANDKYLRMIAEYDNFRKRSAKEKESIYADAQADAVGSILPIGDNLARAALFTDPASVSKGIAMMQKSFEEALSKMGITEIEAEGQEFDPNRHNAVMHVEDESVGENTVVEVLQKGYIRGDRVIRYAMVKVAN
jgi:molecular chaperone GrpE